MKTIYFIKDNIALIVLLTAIVSLFFPITFTWIDPSTINYLLGIIMLLMGMTLNINDFKIVFTRPRDIVIGFLAQFTIMPALAWSLTRIFSLPEEYAIGVILVGCCPGGTASNVITYLSRGDIALSVGITSVSTIFAPLLTPLACWYFAGAYVDVDILGMLLSIVKIVILPIIAGFILQKYFPKLTKSITTILPALSTLVIALIVGIVIGMNSEKLLDTGLTVICVIILHNILGYIFGFVAGIATRMSPKKCIALSIEVGMQNSGLACSLAQQHFSTLQAATVPGAIFSVWHNISGAIIAKIFTSLSWQNTSKEEQREESE